MSKMRKTGIIGAAIAMAVLLAPISRAGVIYSQTFDTDTSNLLGTYGFSANSMPSTTAAGGQALFTVSGYANLYTSSFASSFTYDWSQPLTVSADIGSPNGGGGQSYGIALHSGTAPSSSSGLSWNFYWPSSGSASFLAKSNGDGTRVGVNPDPDVTASSTTMYTVAMTVREHAGNSSLFDLRLQVNGVAQVTPNGTWSSGTVWPTGVDGDWIVGFSKSEYGIAGADPFNAIGVRADGLSGTARLDNLTLTVIPEPGSLTLLGLLGGALLLRRKLRQSR